MRSIAPLAVTVASVLGLTACTTLTTRVNANTIPATQMALCITNPQILHGNVTVVDNAGTEGERQSGFFFVCATSSNERLVLSLQDNPAISILSPGADDNSLFSSSTAIADSSGVCLRQIDVVYTEKKGQPGTDISSAYAFIPRQTASGTAAEIEMVDSPNRLPQAATCRGQIEQAADDALLIQLRAYNAAIDAVLERQRQQQVIEALRNTI
jgi:hypothetical protein